jgi:site-specific DNA recombinase
VLIKSPEHFVFVLENGLEYEGQAYCSSQQTTHVETVISIKKKR